MLGGIFEKNNVEDKIRTFVSKTTEINFWKDKFLAQKILKKKKSLKIFLTVLIIRRMN